MVKMVITEDSLCLVVMIQNRNSLLIVKGQQGYYKRLVKMRRILLLR